jgi:hypothetical protein
MSRRWKLAVSGLLLAFACGPGADVNGFPNAYAAAYCHFAYHCCTPVERQTFPSGFAQQAVTLGFDDEGDCTSRLSASAQTTYQPLQASVKDKRITWNQTAAQACLTALSSAASSCNAQSFQIALNGDPSQPGVLAVCDQTQFTTGLVAATGTCTINQDCAGAGSVCTPLMQTGTTQTIEAGGTCTPLPTAGQNCPDGTCATNNSCCNAQVCVAYVTTGATCTRSDFGECSSAPCLSTNFCGYTNNAYSCQAKIAGGQPCGVDENGIKLDDSCLSGTCTNGSCTAPPGSDTTYKICSGNPDGI